MSNQAPEHQPLVSVIIPAYNAEKFVVKAINSIINQTYTNLEIWLLDDASTDNTRNILKGFKDQRIKTFFVDVNTKKIGIVNDVLNRVNGDLIAFQDADDWSDPTRIEKQVQRILEEQGIGIVFTNIDVIHTNSYEVMPIEAPLTNKEIKSTFFKYGKSNNNKNIACATMVVKKAIIDEIGGYHPYFTGKAGSDIFWTYRILKYTKAACTKERLYHVQRTQNSFTEDLHNNRNIKSSYIWKVISKIIEYDQKGINLLSDNNKLLLKELELEACEEKFREVVKQKEELISIIRKSKSYLIGNFILKPFHFFAKKL